jgi:hypothetical protein
MKLLRGIKVLCIVCIACLVLGFVVEHLWNWLMPSIFGLRTITYWQALGLLVLSKILLGGFHKHGRNKWKRGMDGRFANMTPEERMRFREGMRNCGWGRHEDRAAKPGAEPAQ